MESKIYYRISDKGYPKPKMIGIDNRICFKNFLDAFSGANIKIIADNCNDETIEMFSHYCGGFSSARRFELEETNLGNAGSLRHALTEAETLPDDTCVYFVEDDYLHAYRSKGVHTSLLDIIHEGLEIANYVTLFDHPDKYSNLYNFGEDTRVFRTKSTHWKQTASTCMTFATTVETLKDDFHIWMNNTEGDHPHDHKAFTEVKEREASVICCIPGLAFHTDLTEQLRLKNAPIDDWAIQMVERLLLQKLSEEEQYDVRDMLSSREGLDRINLLGAYVWGK